MLRHAVGLPFLASVLKVEGKASASTVERQSSAAGSRDTYNHKSKGFLQDNLDAALPIACPARLSSKALLPASPTVPAFLPFSPDVTQQACLPPAAFLPAAPVGECKVAVLVAESGCREFP
mmetsp:Transcript_112636/g.223986  ORF Transcript_112636/g.223986 Transcript_112636/m.223986 type:complete len:121 (-) Transcript_112636:247-609(-)